MVAAAALAVALYAVYRGNRNTSAATLVALNLAFRDAWDRFLHDKELKDFHFAELMNLFEVGCAICQERSLIGVSRKLVKHYMDSALRQLIENEYADQRVPELLLESHTFEHVKKFLKAEQRSLSVTVPPKWFENL